LVDHNKLIKPWGDDDGKPVHGKVVALIDHHADEGLYKDTADPREIIMPVGSCASLVTDHFKDAWSGLVPPPELATLLLSAIMIDTQGLKSGGKAEPKDHEAVAFLIPHSPFNPSVNDTQVTAPFAPSADHPIPSGLADFSEQLSTTKFSISHLSSEDLLRRDYKQYEFGSKSNVRVGLSTVPYDLEEWIVKDPELIASVRNWAKKKSLAVAGVLTSFHNKKGHHRRQMLVLIMAENRAAIEEKLFNGLEADETMGLKKFKGFLSKSDDKNEEGDAVAVWKQGDAKASRKQIAPAFKAILDTL
jgi:exopolyphosphatase